MASFKLNIARIRGCPEPKELAEALAEYGLPDGEEFGVLNHSVSPAAVYASIVRRSHQTIQRLDPETKEVTSAAVEKATVYPFGVNPAKETLEIYAGSAAGIEQLGVFFSSCLALPTIIDVIELDIPSAVDKLAAQTERFQLRSVRITDYAHNSYMAGTYAPKFLDSQHGKDFMADYVEHVASASVRFAAPNGRINATLSPKTCFSFSCHEDDQSLAQAALRKLI